MILECSLCGESFQAGTWQIARKNKGATLFACSLSCRGALNMAGIFRAGTKKPSDIKNWARKQVANACRGGRLVRASTCELCAGTKNIQAHHHAGYENPLEVQWICVACHARIDRRTKAHGVAHPHAKLTSEKVRRIRRLLRSGLSLANTARVFEVSKKTIVNIKLGRVWAHVS